MNDRPRSSETVADSEPLASLRFATRKWIEGGKSRLLERWLSREVDAAGVPRRLPIPQWPLILVELARAKRGRSGWPEGFEARITRVVETILRFSRPSGVAVTTGIEDREIPNLREALRFWGEAYSGTGIARVLNLWFPKRDREEFSPPPLPAWSSETNPLAILRADWLKSGDFLAVDHRMPGPTTGFELFGGGKTWLGPEWSLNVGEGGDKVSRPKVQAWQSSWIADLVEWSFRVGTSRVTRTAVLFRGRRLALLADQVDFPGAAAEEGPISLNLRLDRDVRPETDETSRALSLRRVKDRSSARIYPLGLPCLPYKTDKGRFDAADGRLTLTQARSARRIWLPLLVSWDASRNRKPIQWRALTVSERSRNCPPGVAFAVRARWGLDETIVIYRSLAKPGLRAFLGHQTKARFLIGTFSNDGVLKPLISLE